MVAVSPMILVADPALPVRNVDELVAFAKRRPGKLTYGSSGVGGMPHLSMESFKRRTGIDATHIPFKGANESLLEVMNGHVSIVFCAMASALPYIQAGQLKPLGIAARERNPEMPDLPTVEEGGVSGFEVLNWFGVVGPAGMKRSIVERLNAEIANVVGTREASERFSELGFTPRASTPEVLMKHIREEYRIWKEVIHDQRIMPQ
jgi:tripartite-type tricarboxylate transporter receptor subunit TctC